MLVGKTLAKKVLATAGFRLSRIPRDGPLCSSEADVQASTRFLKDILPVVASNATTGQWPTPQFLEEYFTPERLAMLRLLLDQCDANEVVISGKSVLDVGCHAGCLLRLISERYDEVALTGCDISDVKLSMARRGCPEAELFFCSLSDLPGDSNYDVVFLTEVLEHLVDPGGALGEVLNAASDQGTVILTVPDGRQDTFPAKGFDDRHQSYAGHINFWSPESWKYFLARHTPGTRVVTAQLPTGHLFAAITKPGRKATAATTS